MDDEVHQKILKENRVYFVRHLNLKDTLVLDQLVQDGVLGSDQLTAMKEKYVTNGELASALVCHLERRPGKDWNTFLSCLSDHDHRHIIDHITVKQPQLENVVLQQKMESIILRQYAKIPLWTLHSDHVRVPMEDMYVNLVLVKDRIRKHDDEEKLQSYKDIFRKSERRSTLFLSGEPGVGKTTFIKHMCVDWAKTYSKEDETKFEAEKTLSYFYLVLPVFLRDIKPDQSFCDVIAEEYQLKPEETEELYHFIYNTDNPILVIADGLDEYDENTSTEITQLLTRKLLPHVTLFVTSRFSSESFYCDEKHSPELEVSLRGFSQEGVNEYVGKFYHHEKEVGDALLLEIQNSEDLIHLSQYPAVLLMMATLWESTRQLARTVTGFYQEFVAFVFARQEKKLKKVSERAKSTEQLLIRYHKNIMALGQLSTSNIKTHRLELIFQHEEVMKYIQPEDFKTGFLVEKRTLSRKTLYLYIHKTVQEFFLSYYLVFSDRVRKKELLLQFFSSRRAFSESSMLRRFVTGLGGEEMRVQIDTLISGEEREVFKMQTELQLDYLAENKEAKILLPSQIRLTVSLRYTGSHFMRYLKQDGGEVKKLWVTTDNALQWRLLEHLIAPHLVCLHLYSLGHTLRSVDQENLQKPLEMTLLKFPLEKLVVNSVCHDMIPEIVRAVVQVQRLHTLSFVKVLLKGVHMQSFIKWLPVSNLSSLRISSCGLALQDIKEMIAALPSSVNSFSLMFECMRGMVGLDRKHRKAISSKQLKSMRMTRCQLSPHDVVELITVLPGSITELDLEGNCQEGGGDMVKLLKHTDRLTGLERLNLSKNRIPHNVLKSIKQVLKKMCPQLLLEIDKQ